MKIVSPKLLLVLALLAVATFLVLRRPGETNVSGTSFLVTYDSSSVDKIEIQSPKETVVLEKQGGTWSLTKPIQYRADQNSVQKAVGTGKSLGITSPVSTNPEKRNLFQVDSSGTLVKISSAGSETGVMYIGKTGSSFSNTYVRAAESNDVYLTDGVLSSVFNRPLKDWRDKTIFQRDKSQIKSVRFQYKDETFTLSLQDSAWIVDADPASETKATPFLNALSNIQTDEFIDTVVTTLSQPTAVISVEGADLTVYGINDGAQYIVRSSASAQLFELNKWRAEQLLKHKKDFIAEQK
ncbi:MAG TPA: DUF4340 domain-containing protein [Bacteroidota bacterium]